MPSVVNHQFGDWFQQLTQRNVTFSRPRSNNPTAQQLPKKNSCAINVEIRPKYGKRKLERITSKYHKYLICLDMTFSGCINRLGFKRAYSFANACAVQGENALVQRWPLFGHVCEHIHVHGEHMQRKGHHRLRRPEIDDDVHNAAIFLNHDVVLF